MSTKLYEGEGVQVALFACGKCRKDGPCFQITGLGAKNGDYVIVHRSESENVARALAEETGLSLHDPADRDFKRDHDA